MVNFDIVLIMKWRIYKYISSHI